MPGAVQLDDDTLNFDGSGFSRRESAGDFLTGGGGAGQVEEEEQEDEGEDAEEVSVAYLSFFRTAEIIPFKTPKLFCLQKLRCEQFSRG